MWGTRCSDRDRGGDLSASSKHRATRHTLRLCMELQTAVCFHILFGTCAHYLSSNLTASKLTLSCLSVIYLMHQSSSELLRRSSCRSQVSVPLISPPVPHYHWGGRINYNIRHLHATVTQLLRNHYRTATHPIRNIFILWELFQSYGVDGNTQGPAPVGKRVGKEQVK